VEAERYGISCATFRDAIDLLIKVGLIDVAESGAGLRREVTRYAISERWRVHGTPEFVEKKREKRRLHYGFTKGNRSWEKKMSTVNFHSCSRVNNCES
jgi:hypothetical protein